MAGRGSKREDWVEYPHSIIMMQFEGLIELYVQITAENFLSLAVSDLENPYSPFKNMDVNIEGK